jgi:hypothetical protein
LLSLVHFAAPAARRPHLGQAATHPLLD